MDLEDRVDDLEKSTRDALLVGMATDSVIRALIATHPNPEYFRVVFVSLIERQIALLAEHGFETGRKSHIPKALAEDLRKQCHAWLQVLHGRQKGGESGPPAS